MIVQHSVAEREAGVMSSKAHKIKVTKYIRDKKVAETHYRSLTEINSH